MEYLVISDLNDRTIKLAWSKGKRYEEEIAKKWEPWWNFHLIVKKPEFECDYVSESMTECELVELAELMEKSRYLHGNEEEHARFMEPDYTFTISKYGGSLNINMKYADCLAIRLEREDLDNIAKYIKNLLKK
ncbi:MAG: hypothetical protein IJX55_06830 [Clostridia bacterium]|nr:hypothetical protein [Clostridia bacterium]